MYWTGGVFSGLHDVYHFPTNIIVHFLLLTGDTSKVISFSTPEFFFGFISGCQVILKGTHLQLVNCSEFCFCSRICLNYRLLMSSLI